MKENNLKIYQHREENEMAKQSGIEKRAAKSWQRESGVMARNNRKK